MKNVLALDIGGTNSRIALIEIKNDKPIIIKEKIELTNSVKDLSKFINKFKEDAQDACIGFAGPISGTTAKLTNANLKIDIKDLKKKTKLENIRLINDFHANGYGIRFLNNKEKYVLYEGKKNNKNNVMMVVGPGTGLGKVHIINDNVYPCEPGWTTLGIEDIDDYALFDYLRGKFGRQAYYEDVLSGRGLIGIYDHLEIKSNFDTNMKIRNHIKDEPVHKAKILIKYSKKDQLCDMTLRIFVKFYARFVRDSCLNLLTGKVYLVGGISEAILPYLKKLFIPEFTKHKMYASLLKKVKINVVLNQNLGLIGAGAVAANLV